MSIKIVPIDKTNIQEWRTSVRRVFGDIPSESDVKRLVNDRLMIPYEDWSKGSEKVDHNRLIGAYDEETKSIVGTGGADKFDITVPGGNSLSMAGIAYMGTAPTHKRKGIFRLMMNNLHSQAKDRGDSLAGLWASQSLLYSRFGYGLATLREDWMINAKSTQLNKSSDSKIKIRFVNKKLALKEIPEIYNSVWKKQNGFTDRSQGYWDYLLYENDNTIYNKSGMSGLFFVISYVDNKPTGYVFYNINKESGIAHEDDKGELIIQELVSQDSDSNIALWNFIFGIELVEKIIINRRGSSDPLYFLLENPRMLSRNIIDGLWVRIINPIKMLESRSYNSTGKLILEIKGQNQDDIEGIYSLETDGVNSEVKKVKSNPDISMRPSDMSSCFFGGITPYELYKSNNIRCSDSKKLELFSNMFSVSQTPWCNTDF